MSQASQVLRPQHPHPIDDDAIDIPSAETAAHPAAGIRSGLARSALIVAAAFVLSRMLGLAREIILARQFGTGPEMDAYVRVAHVGHDYRSRPLNHDSFQYVNSNLYPSAVATRLHGRLLHRPH